MSRKLALPPLKPNFDGCGKTSSLRLIGDDGKMIGVMPGKDAVAIARERGLEVACVQGASDPPVWKLIAKPLPPDPATLAASAEEKEEEAGEEPGAKRKKKKKEPLKKPPKMKEVRLTDSIAPRDAEHKIDKARGFLEKGHIVKVLVLNQGKVDPEDSRKALAVSLVEQVGEACKDVAQLSQVQGATGLRDEGETNLTKQILGPCFLKLTPLDGGSRQPMTPRSRRKQRGGDGDG